MKIYWTKKSIPELAPLSKTMRKRNYQQARGRVSSHYEYWVGALFFAILITVLYTLFNYLFPGEDSVLRYMTRSVISIPIAILVWEQFTIYTMRKYYRHILIQNDNATPGV